MKPAKQHPLLPLLTYAIGQPELDSDVARLALTLGKTSNNIGMLTALAEHPDIPSDVRQQLAKVKDAAVRAAYLKRADINDTERRALLESETRGKVLAVLAADASTDPGTLAILAEHKTMLVCVAVLTNEQAPVDIRRKALRSINDSELELNSAQGTAVRAYIQADVEGHDDFAQYFRPIWLEFLTTSETVGPEGIRRIVDECIGRKVAIITSDTADRYERERYANQVGDAINDLLLLPELPDTLLKELKRALKVAGNHMTSYHHPNSKQIQARLTSRTSGPLARNLNLARTSTDGAELARLVTANQDLAILHAVARNRATTPQTTVAAWKLTEYHTEPRGLLEARNGQDDVLLALWAAGYWGLVHWIPTEAEMPLAYAMLSCREAPVSYKSDFISHLHQRGIELDHAASYLTQDAFAHCWAGSPVAALGVAALAAGAKHTPPELLLSVAEGFAGPLGELLDTCQLLAVDATP